MRLFFYGRGLIKLFTGFDQREAIGWHAFAQSVIETTSEPVQIAALSDKIARDGSNAFTYSRFLVPHLCEFQGHAIFVDGSDMLATSDLAQLWSMRSTDAIQVVKHEYRTKHPRKYRGTEMECQNIDYPRKNWSSVIIWNCSHPLNRILTPEYVAAQNGPSLHRFSWLPDDLIGQLPKEWNWLPDEYGHHTGAKLLHWTTGIPGIESCKSYPHSQAWSQTHARALQTPAQSPLRAYG